MSGVGWRRRQLKTQEQAATTDPEKLGRKKCNFFLFSLGFLYGYFRKSNEGEFSRKKNEGGDLENTGAKKKKQFLLFAWFPENEQGSGGGNSDGGRDSKHREEKKKAKKIYI